MPLPQDPTAAGRRRATAIGAIAILLWASLALFTAASRSIPPFQLLAMTFAIAFLLAVARWVFLWRKAGLAGLAFFRQPWPVWAIGIGGLFLYHAFYFTAFAHIPAIEASLIAYLWPLFIVLFSALLPGERLRWQHGLGALLGLAGAAWLLIGNAASAATDGPREAIGYIAAFACALTWSSYSVASRRFGAASSDLIGAFCGATALLGTIVHSLTEPTIWPQNREIWLAILALGLGPVGLAFFVWDIGVKKGDIKALGAASYASPLLSTLLLVLAGAAEANLHILIACIAIIGGALLASRDLWVNPRD